MTQPTTPNAPRPAAAGPGISLTGGKGRASQVLCGVLMIAAINNAVVLLNLSAAYQQLMTAAVLIAAVLLQRTTLQVTIQRLSRGTAGYPGGPS